MEIMNRNPEKRPFFRSVPWIIVYAAALAAIIFVMFGMREDTAEGSFGSLDLRFKSQIQYEYDGEVHDYRGNALKNILFFISDKGPSQPDSQPAFMLLVSADREFRTMTIFYIPQHQLDGSGDTQDLVQAVSGLLGGIPIKGHVSMGMEELSALVRQIEGTSDADIGQALQSADMETSLSQNDILDYMTNWSAYERQDVIKTSDHDDLEEKILETFFK